MRPNYFIFIGYLKAGGGGGRGEGSLEPLSPLWIRHSCRLSLFFSRTDSDDLGLVIGLAPSYVTVSPSQYLSARLRNVGPLTTQRAPIK